MTINEYIPVPVDHPDWVPVTDPKWQPGYTVSRQGEARSPQGKILKPSNQGQLWVSLRRAGAGTSTTRLDKLVLTAFVGPAPGEDFYLMHYDDDPLSDGKIKVCLETVREIITNEMGKPEFVARTSWSYGPDRTGSAHFQANRFDYIPVL